jgi:hypothetical protein
MGWISKLFFKDDEDDFKEAKSNTCIDIWERRGKTIRDFLESDELANKLVLAIRADPFLPSRLKCLVASVDRLDKEIKYGYYAGYKESLLEEDAEEVVERLSCYQFSEIEAGAIVSAIIRWATKG